MIHPDLVTKKTRNKGWGVFTMTPLEAGAFIEESPVIIMNSSERQLLDQTRLHDYLFEWEENNCCMAMGLVPVYNHACPSNCEYVQDYEAGVIRIYTIRPIEAGEELTINYQGDYDNDTPVWFQIKS